MVFKLRIIFKRTRTSRNQEMQRHAPFLRKIISDESWLNGEGARRRYMTPGTAYPWGAPSSWIESFAPTRFPVPAALHQCQGRPSSGHFRIISSFCLSWSFIPFPLSRRRRPAPRWYGWVTQWINSLAYSILSDWTSWNEYWARRIPVFVSRCSEEPGSRTGNIC